MQSLLTWVQNFTHNRLANSEWHVNTEECFSLLSVVADFRGHCQNSVPVWQTEYESKCTKYADAKQSTDLSEWDWLCVVCLYWLHEVCEVWAMWAMWWKLLCCGTDSLFERDALVETIKRRAGVGSVQVTLTTLTTTAASAATSCPQYVLFSLLCYVRFVCSFGLLLLNHFCVRNYCMKNVWYFLWAWEQVAQITVDEASHDTRCECVN